MIFLGAVGSLALVLLILDLWRLARHAGLLKLESQQPAEVATIWLQLARGYTLVRADPAEGLFVWEHGRRFDDGGFLYYALIARGQRTGRAQITVGVIGHKFHSAEERAAARSQFVSTQLFHLTEKSAERALIRAGNPRTAHAVHPAMKHIEGVVTIRPPAIDAPMSAGASRFTLRAPLDAVTDAIGGLPSLGWRILDSTSLSRGLGTQLRYALEDAPERDDAGAEYLLELRWYEGDWAVFSIDWFPRPDPLRPPRRPTGLEAEIRSAVERALTVAEAAE